MGGINETMVPSGDPTTGTQEKVRSHIDTTTGQVHFHDENVTPRRTVAVPISLWHRIHEEFFTLQRNQWKYADPVNGNLLMIEIQQIETDNNLEIKAIMTIKPVTFNETFKTLHNLAVTRKVK